MSALEKKLEQLCKYQDDVSVGLKDGDEYMMRRGMRLRDSLIKEILAEYDPERPRVRLVPVHQGTGKDAG